MTDKGRNYTTLLCFALLTVGGGPDQQGHGTIEIQGGALVTKNILPGSIYIDGNVMVGRAGIDRDNWRGVLAPRSLQSAAPFPAPPVQTQSAAEAFDLVLGNAGATRP